MLMAPRIEVKRNSRGKWIVVTKDVDEEIQTLFALARQETEAYQPPGTEFSERKEAKASARSLRRFVAG
jgi:hypothetical protein